MKKWVDLKIVQWAYAHSQHFSSTSKLEEKFGFVVVSGPTGSILRYNPDGNYTIDDRQILIDFKDEKCLTMFLLRWSQ